MAPVEEAIMQKDTRKGESIMDIKIEANYTSTGGNGN